MVVPATIDCEPPTIKDIDVLWISTGAKIIWTTNSFCDSRLWFSKGAESSDFYYTPWDSKEIHHSVDLDNLNEGQKYYYEIIVRDNCGTRRSGELSFRYEGDSIVIESIDTEDSVSNSGSSELSKRGSSNPVDASIEEPWIVLHWPFVCLGIIGTILLGLLVFSLRELKKRDSGA